MLVEQVYHNMQYAKSLLECRSTVIVAPLIRAYALEKRQNINKRSPEFIPNFRVTRVFTSFMDKTIIIWCNWTFSRPSRLTTARTKSAESVFYG